MDKPFFSIIIPTSNRPEYVRDCIASVLKQSFQGFEILISDNGTTKLCKEVVESLHDKRIIYKRPSLLLGPCDNHDFAQNGFRGEYFILLGDKHRLRRNTLERVYEAIEKQGNNIITFRGEVFSAFDNGKNLDISKGYINKIKSSKEIKIIKTWDMIEEKMQFEDPFGFEKGLIYGNAFYSRTLAEKIIKVNSNHRLFDGAIADRYTSFVAMGLEKQMSYIDEPLSYYIRNGIHTSDIGKKSISVLEDVWKHSNRDYTEKKMLNYVPLKECFALIKNIQAGDYFYAIDRLLNSALCDEETIKKLKLIELNSSNYIYGIMDELRSVFSEDCRFSIYKNEVQKYFDDLSFKEKEKVNQKNQKQNKLDIRYIILNKISILLSNFLLNTLDDSAWRYDLCNFLDRRHVYIDDLIEYL